MIFFKTIESMMNGVELQFNIIQKNDQLTVMVMPKATIKDKAAGNIRPLIITGTADELDAGFLESITGAIATATGLMSNIVSFEAGADKLAKENEVEKKKAELDKKEKEVKTKKYTSLMAKYDTFKKDNKMKEAIGVLKQAKEFSTNAASIDKIIAECVAKLSQGSIFDATPLEDDKTDYLADFVDDLPVQEEEETEDDNEETED